MNKVLVKLYIPALQEEYDVLIPISKKIYSVTELLIKAINEFNNGFYNPKNRPILYDKITAEPYNINDTVKEAGIKNSTEMILI